MGLPYNPSSFANNKTILEAIEELKHYLAQNPLTSIFAVDRNWTLTTLPISYIINPANRDIEIGDMLVSGNAYGIITDVGDTDVEIANGWYGFGDTVSSISINVDTTYQEVIDAPATFTAWIYRYDPRGLTQYRRGARYELSIAYTDMYGNTHTETMTLPTQSVINAIWYYTESDGSKTIYVDITKEDNTFEESNFNIPKGADGSDGADGVSVVGATIDGSNHLILTLSDGNTIDAGLLPSPIVTADSIDSETATSGQVLTADGSGGASWDTISTGYSNTVSISSTSGTFTDSEFAKLGYGDSTIVYTDAYSVSTVYKLKLETASILEFEAIDAASRNNLKLIDVNKTTKAYSMTSISMIKSATFDSGTATSGKVLTANGSGGTSWETVSAGSVEGTAILSTGETSGKVLTADGSGGASWQTAGGGGKYAHFISLYHTINYQDGFKICLMFINNDSSSYQNYGNYNALYTALRAFIGDNTIMASGCYNDSATTSVVVCGINAVNNYLYLVPASDNSITHNNIQVPTSSVQVIDTVVQIS